MITAILKTQQDNVQRYRKAGFGVYVCGWGDGGRLGREEKTRGMRFLC